MPEFRVKFDVSIVAETEEDAIDAVDEIVSLAESISEDATSAKVTVLQIVSEVKQRV